MTHYTMYSVHVLSSFIKMKVALVIVAFDRPLITKVIIDLYINDFHDKLLYMYYGQINHSDTDCDSNCKCFICTVLFYYQENVRK